MVSASGCQPRTAAKFWRVAAAKAVTNLRFPTSDISFGRNCRLADDALIRRTLRYGSKRESDNLRLQILPTPESECRWCLRVPKQLGNSVARNRLRRLMREFLRHHRRLWPQNSAAVLTAKPGAKLIAPDELAHELGTLLSNE